MKRKHKWKWVGCWWCTLCGTVRLYSDKTYSIYYLRPKGLKPTKLPVCVKCGQEFIDKENTGDNTCSFCDEPTEPSDKEKTAKT